MGSVKAAVFCHAPWEPEGREMERELSRQLELLEEGCKKRGIEVVARYFHVGQTGLHPKGSVMLDMLRANRDRLQKAMDDTSTPANALPAISRQLIDVCERIESLQGGGLTDLLDDEEDEVTDDVGASIV